jgi:hypothetical protein
MKYLLILSALIIGILAYTSYHEHYSSREEKKLLNSQIKGLQHINDSLSHQEVKHEKIAKEFIFKTITVQKLRELSEREVDSLMDMYKPTTFDSAEFKRCNEIVVAQTKEIKIDNNLISLKDSVIANTEFALGDANSMLNNKDMQLSDKNEIIKNQQHEIRVKKANSFLLKVVAAGEAVVIGYLTILKK